MYHRFFKLISRLIKLSKQSAISTFHPTVSEPHCSEKMISFNGIRVCLEQQSVESQTNVRFVFLERTVNSFISEILMKVTG